MAKYENLPIYRKAMELLVYVEQSVRGFPRYHKYAIGARLRDACFDVASLIVEANNAFDRAERTDLLGRLRDRSEDVKICLEAARELQAFSGFKAYNHAAGMAVEVCRQSEGWLGSSRRIPPPESYPRLGEEARP